MPEELGQEPVPLTGLGWGCPLQTHGNGSGCKGTGWRGKGAAVEVLVPGRPLED